MTNDKYNIDDILDELEKQADEYLSEESFYTTFDNRVLKSYVEDIDDGDNFADYCKELFELLEEEGYYD
jgi:hypothetical protein